ncbi:MAG: hypothetical protein JNJ54_20875 [Myxococcaceae bacterium]|nr:hypothetical protein [Myxococcaceae bacterium]
MKVICPSCERLIEVTTVRVVGDSAFFGCAKCGVESALPVTTEALPSFPETPKAAPPLPLSSRKTPGPRALVLASSSEASNVVMLRAPTAAAVDSARAFADADPFAVPEGFCPKCISRRDGQALASASRAGASPSRQGERAQDAACPICGLVFANVDVGQLSPPADLAAMWKELLREWGDEGRHAAVRRLAMERNQLPDMARLYRLRLAAMPEDPIAQRGRDEVLAAASAVVLLPRGPREPAKSPLVVKVLVGGLALTVIVVAVTMMVRMLS